MDIYWNIHGIQLEYSMHLGLLKMIWLLFPMAPKSRDCFIFPLEKSTINILLEWLKPPARMLQDTTLVIFGLICSIQAGTFWTLGSRCTCTCSTRSWAHWVSAWFQRDVLSKQPIEKRGWSQSPYRRLYCKPKRSHWPSYMAGLNLPGLGRFSWTKHGMGIESLSLQKWSFDGLSGWIVV